jgi:hypothetical protein
MKKFVALGITIALPVFFTGCGSQAENLANELVGLLNDQATALEGVKDDASASAAIDKINKIAERRKEIYAKMKDLKPTVMDGKNLEESKQETAKALMRIMKATQDAFQKAPGKRKELGEAITKSAAPK